MKTLHLLYPDWQSSGRNNRTNSGAYTVHQAFSHTFDFTEIGIVREERLVMEGNILGRSAIARHSEQMQLLLQQERPDKLFMIGGTCGSDLAPVAYLNTFYEGDLAVLWLDAHGDLNTPESSPSGNFHGMVLRSLLGEGDANLLRFVHRKLLPSQVTLAGVRDLDISETEYATTNNIPLIGPDQIKEASPLISAINRHGSNHLHIHLDLDFFNPDDFQGAHMPTPGGLTMDQFRPILAELNSQYNIVGLSIVEFGKIDLAMAAKIPSFLERTEILTQFKQL